MLYTGVGKVNAASATTLALLERRPTLRDQLRHRRQDHREARRPGRSRPCLAARHDGDAAIAARADAVLLRTSTGCPRATATSPAAPATASSPQAIHGSIENGVDIVDMELFAIAHVCQRHDRAAGARSNSSPTMPTTSPRNIGPPMSPMAQSLFWDAVKDLRN